MNAICERCRHRADLDMRALIAKLGVGFTYVGPDLERHLWCSRCGEKAVSVQIHYLHSNRSRFADRAMPRYKQRIEAGPKLSDDRHDKFIAAMNWYVGRHKGDPEFARAPHYYEAVSEWFDRLPLDDQERVHTVQYVYSTPGYGGEAVAITYAALLRQCPCRPSSSARRGATIETLTPGLARARLAVLAALALCSNQYSVAPRRELHCPLNCWRLGSGRARFLHAGNKRACATLPQ